MSETEHGKFASDTTAAAGHDAAPLAEPEGVNAGSSQDPATTVATDSPRPSGRHRAETPSPAGPDAGSQKPRDDDELLGAPTAEPVSGQDSGSMD